MPEWSTSGLWRIMTNVERHGQVFPPSHVFRCYGFLGLPGRVDRLLFPRLQPLCLTRTCLGPTLFSLVDRYCEGMRGLVYFVTYPDRLCPLYIPIDTSTRRAAPLAPSCRYEEHCRSY